MTTKTTTMRLRSSSGMLLLWLFGGIALLGLALGMAVPVAQITMERLRFANEKDLLLRVSKEIEASFEKSTTATNMGVVAADDTAVSVTTFDSATSITSLLYAGSVTVPTTNHWIAKLVALRGSTVSTATAYTEGSGSDVYTVGVNSYGARRILLAGPATEPQQRYLLISVMAPTYRGLAFPAIGTVFDDIWNNRWNGDINAQAPASWSAVGALTSGSGVGSYAQWNVVGSGGRTNAARVVVQKIVQRKHKLVVTNNHPNDTLWVDIGFRQNAIIALPATGVTQSSGIPVFANGIPEGREIVARRGLTSATAVEVARFYISDNASLWVQSN